MRGQERKKPGILTMLAPQDGGWPTLSPFWVRQSMHPALCATRGTPADAGCLAWRVAESIPPSSAAQPGHITWFGLSLRIIVAGVTCYGRALLICLRNNCCLRNQYQNGDLRGKSLKGRQNQKGRGPEVEANTFLMACRHQRSQRRDPHLREKQAPRREVTAEQGQSRSGDLSAVGAPV